MPSVMQNNASLRMPAFATEHHVEPENIPTEIVQDEEIF